MKKHFTNFSRIQAAEAPEFIRGEEPQLKETGDHFQS